LALHNVDDLLISCLKPPLGREKPVIPVGVSGRFRAAACVYAVASLNEPDY